MKIVAVSYLNTLPFVYGIEQAAPWLQAELLLCVPAACVDASLSGEADIALLPVAAIPSVPGASIITDYCLGAEGPIRTVALLGNTPPEAVTTVYLDLHSRTSVQLVRLLARELWGIQPQWIDREIDTIDPASLREGEALLAIGDKVFELEHRFTHNTDLAVEWQRHTSLPFVFAAWVALTPAGRAAADDLNRALQHGIENIADAITGTWNRTRDYDFGTAYDYLTENLKYRLDAPKYAAMKLFWERIKNPG